MESGGRGGGGGEWVRVSLGWNPSIIVGRYKKNPPNNKLWHKSVLEATDLFYSQSYTSIKSIFL